MENICALSCLDVICRTQMDDSTWRNVEGEQKANQRNPASMHLRPEKQEASASEEQTPSTLASEVDASVIYTIHIPSFTSRLWMWILSMIDWMMCRWGYIWSCDGGNGVCKVSGCDDCEDYGLNPSYMWCWWRDWCSLLVYVMNVNDIWNELNLW